MTLVIDQDMVMSKIPHRYENLLIDTLTLTDDNRSLFDFSIKQNDALNRDIFFWSLNHDTLITVSTLAEISMISSFIRLFNTISHGTFGYFVAVFNFSIEGHPIMSEHPMVGETTPIRKRGNFYRDQFSISNDHFKATGHMMAYYDNQSNQLLSDADGASLDALDWLPQHGTGQSLPAFSSKPEWMTFVDTVYDSHPNQSTYGYTYPVNHPLTKGHFPGNPIMMGVCQWQTVEDALTHHANQCELAAGDWSLDAYVVKPNRVCVCEGKKMVFTVYCDESNRRHASTRSISKILFKQPVFPGEMLYIHLTNITSHSD